MARIPKKRTLSGELKKTREQVTRQSNSSAWFGTGYSVIGEGQVAQDGDVTVTSPGALIIDGADVVMIDQAPSATVLFRLGVMPNGDRGLQIFRNNGIPAFEVRDRLGLGTQSVGMRDGDDILIAGTGLFGSGLGAPFIPIPWTPVDYTSAALAQSTTSTTFAATHEHRGFKQNNVVWPQFMARCSDGTTAGQIQLYSVTTGQPLAKQDGTALTITIPAGTTTFSLFEFADYVYLPGSFGTPVHYQVQVKRTAGTGSVTVAPVRSVGVRDGLSAH